MINCIPHEKANIVPSVIMDKKALLEWYMAAGVDEITDDSPTDYFSLKPSITTEINVTPDIKQVNNPFTASPASKVSSPPLHLAPTEASNAARNMADNCKTLAELEEAVRNFDGCALKKTATKTVFSDGNPQAKIMVIGEAPGMQEDIQGIPFCGASGQLLDRMFKAIGLDRSTIYISNTIFWRPPGNRQPNEIEIVTCLPFVEKHIAIISPSLLILSGGTATNALLKKEQSISRLRGNFYEYQNRYMEKPVKTALIYHPSYLLRQPLYKKQAWQDLLMIQGFLADSGKN